MTRTYHDQGFFTFLLLAIVWPLMLIVVLGNFLILLPMIMNSVLSSFSLSLLLFIHFFNIGNTIR